MPITHNIIKDQSLSSEVEAWLANNKPQVLKMGESLGEIRYTRTGASNKSVEENVRTEKERDKKIKEYNKLIKKVKSNQYATKQELDDFFNEFNSKIKEGEVQDFSRFAGVSKHVVYRAKNGGNIYKSTFVKLKKALLTFEFGKPKPPKTKPVINHSAEMLERLEEQRKFIAYFRENAKNGDHKRLAKITGFSSFKIKNAEKNPIYSNKDFNLLKTTIENFEFFKPKRSKIATRITEIKKLRRQAMVEGKNEFQAECKKHGLTTYMIERGLSRCKICRTQAINKSNEKKRTKDPHKLAIKEAKRLSKTSFTSVCKFHGESTFTFRGTRAKCVQCVKPRVFKEKTPRNKLEKKPIIYGEAYKRKIHNTAKKKEAIANGLDKFIGLCKKHGEASYTIYSERCVCDLCKKENNNASYRRKPDSNVIENRNAMMQAIAEGKKEFTAICKRHGETKFIYYKRRDDSGYCLKCYQCKIENESKYRAKRLQMKLNSTKI